MKKFGLLFATALALLALAACSEKEEPDNSPEAVEDPTIAIDASGWHAPAKGALSTEIAVEAEGDWNHECTADWLTVAKTRTGMTLTATENVDTEERSTRVTLTCTNGISSFYEYVTVTQDGKAYISFSREFLSLTYGAGSASVAIESNFDWDYTYETDNGWFTITRNGDSLIATTTANDTGEEREGTVTLTAGDGKENVTETQLRVVQTALSEDDMVLTYTIAASGVSIRLPLYGTVDCTVDWGDGSEAETVTFLQPSHTYTAKGEYDVTISGTVTALSYENLYSYSEPQTTLTAVRQWGNTSLTDMSHAFYYCESLRSLPENAGEVFANVKSFNCAFVRCESLSEISASLFGTCPLKATDFYAVFENCISLKAIPAGLFDNCTEATSFNEAFFGCTIEDIPQGLFDKCTKVTNFGTTFYSCQSLKRIPTGLFDKCTKVTSFSGVFQNCTSLTEIPVGLFDNCTAVTSFYAVFAYCSAITEIPSGLFDKCPKVTNFGYAFDGLKKITAIPGGLFDNCPLVTNFYATFYNCSSITEIPSGLFDKCSEVTNFGYVFSYCSDLRSIPNGLFDKCTKVTNFECSFNDCLSLLEIPEGLFDNCPKVTTFEFCFNSCAALTSIPSGLFDKCLEVTNFGHVFQTCPNITKCPVGLFDHNLKVTNFTRTFCNWIIVTGESPYTEVEVNGEKVKVHLYEREKYTSELGCVKPTSYTECFYYSTFSDMDSIPSDWGGGTSANSISESSIPCAETPVVEPESVKEPIFSGK